MTGAQHDNICNRLNEIQRAFDLASVSSTEQLSAIVGDLIHVVGDLVAAQIVSVK